MAATRWQGRNGSVVWLQLVAEFSRRVMSGEWAVGERISSVRTLSQQLGVNSNTAQRALQELEREGLLRSEGPSGRFVTDDQSIVDAVRGAAARCASDEYVQLSRSLGMGRRDAILLIRDRWDAHGGGAREPGPSTPAVWATGG